MNLNIDNDQLSKIISAHLFENMGAEERENLLRRAIEQVFSGKGVYGPHTNTIHDIFRQRVAEIVKDRMAAEAANPESGLRKMIDGALEAYVTKLRDNPKPLVDFIETAVNSAVDSAMKHLNRGF